MKTFQRFTVMIAACMALTQFTFAENPAPVTSGTTATTGTNSTGKRCQGKFGRHGKRLEHLAQALGLTDQQKAQLKELIKAQRPELKAIRQNETLTKEQKKEQARQIFTEIKQEAKSFLTPEQQQKWDALRAAHQKNS